MIAQCNRKFRPRGITSLQSSNIKQLIKAIDQMAHAPRRDILDIHGNIV